MVTNSELKIEPQEISKEEMFAYWITQGKSKTKAYEAVVDTSSMSRDSIKAQAWKLANKSEVVSLLANEQDNSYIKYMKMRDDVLGTMYDIAMNGSSERAQIDSASTLLTATAKLAKNSVDITINNNEFVNVLNDLRSVLLETPQTILPTVNNSLSDSIVKSENFSNSISNSNVEIENFSNVREGLYIGDKILTQDALDEQVSGINPLGNRKGDKHSRIQDYGTGKFVDYKAAQDWLDSKVIENKEQI